ncbi:hypothetical protein BO83DRAFT_416895 [Aspergillus eucalypticola CBS 122712]|uniref:DASH complex subunit DAD3 n=1 Tax=Aspergillus eucalypticola (strain CBS 122712 / IBT 29274) TaxID=1448314 RepID=A0A317VKI1_ASPEC|nr:uncharacterized protein BO83DRAFT_416895 [Aspergillus eucalypticola CBS 122712]PWY74029.1 hypothetical protein BO83DRAFT_416895 [Aspergillus eucalypticola CBS 122712]
MSSPPDSHNHTPLHDQDPSPSSAPDETPNNPLLRTTNPLVSSLEQEVLDEYTRLLGNVNKLSTKLSTLAESPTTLTLDGLRGLERQTATVCTLLKASVYSIVLQQQIFNESEEQQQMQMQQQEMEGDGDGYSGMMGQGGEGGEYGYGDGGYGGVYGYGIW